METPLHLPESNAPSSIREVISALEKQGLFPVHDKKSWGDWINFSGADTVISIESLRGYSRMATIEGSDRDSEELHDHIIAAFASLGWYGSDEYGEYAL
ncbi:MAG: hypothetical protein O3A92_16885 [Verrucomicrobia bacterium]|nr:hypothetical protein [Verrucomicrobiota bacterium]